MSCTRCVLLTMLGFVLLCMALVLIGIRPFDYLGLALRVT